MTPSSDFPIEDLSSNPGGQDGLKDPTEEPWESEPDDDTPSVTYRIDPSDKPIDEVEVPDQENVKKITVEVRDSDDNPVGILYL